MEVEVPSGISPWDGVVELTKAAQEKDSDPVVWGIQIYSNLNAAGDSLLSMELANVLISYICWDNNVPILWKFLDKALVLKNRVALPPSCSPFCQGYSIYRHFQPAVYRLFMQLLKTHAFQLKSQINGPNYQKIMKSIDAVLHLSHIFGMSRSEPGILVVEFMFSIVWQLLDASLGDEGLLELTPEKKSRWATLYQEMELERPAHWLSFVQRLQLLAANSSALRNSKTFSPEALLQLTSDTHMVLS